VILVGTRDLDAEEQRQLEQSDVRLVKSEGRTDGDIFASIEAELAKLQDQINGVYLHIDMDAFEIRQGRANHYGATGGLSVELIEAAIDRIKTHFKIKSATVASFDPAGDTKGLFLEAGLRCIRRMVA
jgi:arginase family enzyme